MKPNTECYRTCFLYTGCIVIWLWNNLPIYLLKKPSTSVFTKKVATFSVFRSNSEKHVLFIFMNYFHVNISLLILANHSCYFSWYKYVCNQCVYIWTCYRFQLSK